LYFGSEFFELLAPFTVLHGGRLDLLAQARGLTAEVRVEIPGDMVLAKERKHFLLGLLHGLLHELKALLEFREGPLQLLQLASNLKLHLLDFLCELEVADLVVHQLALQSVLNLLSPEVKHDFSLADE